MIEEVDHAIARLRQAVSAKTDAELAARLNVDQSTVSAWLARGRVPDKYLKKYAGADNRSPILSAPKGLDEIESRSHSIALVRFLILRRDEIGSKSINPTMSLFMNMRPFWLIMYRSVSCHIPDGSMAVS